MTPTHSKSPRYAAIDLGTNSCRMIVAQATPQHTEPFKTLDAASVPVYLGEKLATSGKLSEESMQRSISALEIFAKRFDKWKPQKITAVATESFRRASNGAEFVDAIKEKFHIDMRIIKPQEEMQYALLSCRELFNDEKPYGLLFDIGGGSLQIAWLSLDNPKRPESINILSLPIGLAILKEQYGTSAIDDETQEKINNSIADHIQKFDLENNISQNILEEKVSSVGASGVLTSLTCLQYGYERYNRKQIDGEQLNIEGALHVAERLRKLEREQRAAYGCVGQERADMLAVGCAIVLCIFRLIPLKTLAIADRGLREGIVIHMIDQQDNDNPDTKTN